MDLIKKIEIKHFRSINELVIDDLSHINVFSGLNDVGKSNVLKALNLFFNSDELSQSDFDFHRDTNTFHAHRSRKGKVRKLISVKLTFANPSGRYPRLPDIFWIQRQWDRDNLDNPDTTWGEAGVAKPKDNWQRGLTEFLYRSRFYYVPAIRTRSYMTHLIGQFLEVGISSKDPELQLAIDTLTTTMNSRTDELKETLRTAMGIDVEFQLPSDILALLRAADVITEGNIPLQFRGDGIQSLSIPAILGFLSGREQNEFCYWGFEEPENSLEYLRTSELATKLQHVYSKKAQVFLTTHSPAFFATRNDKTSVFLVSQKLEEYALTGHAEMTSRVDYLGDDDETLPELLGLNSLYSDFHENYKNALDLLNSTIRSHEEESNLRKTPRLIVEGKLDRDTLEYVWTRLYLGDMPFEIKAARDANGVTDQVRVWSDISTNRVCALYDHDDAGIKAIKRLDKHRTSGFVRELSFEYCRYKNGEEVLALSLPSPPGRKKNAENLNLPLEFYLPDPFLAQLDENPDTAIFSRTTYIRNGLPTKESKKGLELLICGGEVTMAHRQIDGPGKDRVVEHLRQQPNSTLENFRDLFEIIVGHLDPNHELKHRALETDE